MAERTAGQKLKWLRNAIWIAAFGSFGLTEAHRWITGALFLLAFGVGWFVDKIERPLG